MPETALPERFCCDDLASAYAVTFLNPLRGEAEWLAYGTDFESASAGAPEIRFWPVRYCPFCGATLPALAELAPVIARPDA